MLHFTLDKSFLIVKLHATHLLQSIAFISHAGLFRLFYFNA